MTKATSFFDQLDCRFVKLNLWFFFNRYQFLEYICTKRLEFEPNSTHFVATKLFADTFLFGPLHLLAFLLYIGLAAGKSFFQVRHDIQREFISTFMAEAVIWMCVQVRNSLLS